MALINIGKTIELDVYDHDTTPSVIKAIQLDEGTRTVSAVIQNSRQDYDIGQNAEVKLTVLRPDKTKVQIVGETFSYAGADGTMYGAKADLSDVALAVKGTCRAQFKMTSGEQELRTEIFAINNGEALDAGDGDWAGDLDGHNLDEMAQDIEDTKAAVSEMGSDVSNLKEDLNIINPTADITWELGKGISSSGDVINNQYMALSNDIQCEPGDFFVTTSPTTDANNKFLVYYIIQYNGDTFISRTEFTVSIRSIVIGENTTKIRVAFGRYGSSQTPISQQDITNYVAIKFTRKAASKADTNLQFRNTVLNKYTDIGTDINNITENSFVFSPEGTANNPTTTGGYFIQTILYNTSGTAAMQVAYKYDVGLCYYRRKVNGSWQSWILNTAPANPTRPVYYAFGDSLTYGAVWTPKDESPYYQITQASLINQIPTRIANAIGAANSFSNKGVGGAYFVGTGTNKIITAIQNQDLSNAKIITIAGGRNDSENTLGDKTSTSGDGTICGAIREILDYVTTNYKKLQIVWIGVTPNTRDNSTVFTRVFAGGWSLNSFDEKVSELCAEYCIPYVDWKKCTCMKHWADFSGAGDVYSHPNNEESYLQMGNYIAGQVAQYYRG